MDPRRRQQLQSDIASLEATNRANRSQISRNNAMIREQPRGAAIIGQLTRENTNLELDIKHNTQRISELRRELQK